MRLLVPRPAWRARVGLCAASLLASMPGRARAVEAPQPQPTPTPRFYSTATVEARPVASGARAVSVVERAELEPAAASSVADALELHAGVFVQRAGSHASSSHLTLRAGDPNFTLVLLDGVPYNDPTDVQGGAVDLEALPAEALERVEIVRGPASAFYGSTGLSGVVQLFTRRLGTHRPEARASLLLGNASGRRAALSAGAPFGAGTYGVFGTWTQAREEGRVGDDRLRQWNAVAGLAREGQQLTLRLRARLGARDTRDYPEASGGPLYGSGELRDTAADDGSLRLEAAFGAHTRRHTLGLSFGRQTRARESPGVAPRVPASHETTRFTRLGVEWRAPLIVRARLVLAGGASLEHESARATTLLRLPPEAGGELDGPYAVTRGIGGPFIDALVTRGAWSFEGGLRLDVSSAASAQWSPRLGVRFAPGRARTHLRAAVGSAFKLPGFFALASPAVLGGNPALRPESARSAELGVAHAWRPHARFELCLFESRYRELIDFDFARFTHLNRRGVRARGVEGSARLGPARARLDLAASWQHVEQDDGVPLLQRPRWLARAGLTWRSRQAWRLRIDARATSGALDRQLSAPERTSVAGHVVLGAGLAWRPRAGQLEVTARADNLADARYETLIGFPGPGRALWVGGVLHGGRLSAGE